MKSTSAFSREQISQYLKFIQLAPREGWTDDNNASTEQSSTSAGKGNDNGTNTDTANGGSPALTLSYLTSLHIHQISTIPYENLSLHYSLDRQVILDPQHLYEKFLGRKRGGYCLENSIFFNHVLRALGFTVYTAGVRIRLRKEGVPFGPFVGWCHVVNIVTLPDPSSPTGVTKYMVDVGFGGDGATRPIPLTHDRPQQNLGPQHIRLIYDTIEEQNDRSDTQKLWIYQYRNGEGKDWNTYYAFPEVEFTPMDFRMVNFWLVNSPDSLQRTNVLAIKFFRGKRPVTNGFAGDGKDHVAGDDGQEEVIVSKTMLMDGILKRNLGGKTQLVANLKTEAERIQALREYFGLVLSDGEVAAIQGHPTQLGVDPL